MKRSQHSCSANGKAFGLALQALALMTDHPCRHPSSHIADHLCSEATQIRRILAKLAQENILEVREGRDGGYWLARDPASLTFAEVYKALHVNEPFGDGMLDSTGDHPLGVRMHEALLGMAEEINQSIMELLGQRTIADLVTKASIDAN
ncbi:RrF2 family transcriptional regulator [Paenibacillus daejeonensis]|uniref:RrF2 family transcriptional regulator n=1 Tax=Paenibacillus daejeonensis TaxID=135193 RepID=UPI000382B4EF|nr:Rrf2 family transcriptional regulator [Paenibacillus daejeonensis]